MSDLHNLEQTQLELEHQREELDKSLAHWQHWETDYEILKEDIIAARPRTPELLGKLVEAFEGSVLKSQDLQKILVGPDGSKRLTKDVVALLKHRLEYVKGNVDSLSKKRQAITEQLNENDNTLPLDMPDQQGLPLTEILEELDDDGNIIAVSTTNPNQELTQKLQQVQASKQSDQKQPIQSGQPSSGAERLPNLRSLSKSADAAQAAAKARAEELAASLDQDEPEEGSAADFESATRATARLLEQIADVTDSGDPALGPVLVRKPAITDQALTTTTVVPQVPTDESPEDAELRRQMLDYSLNEVGAVVAEMDLEDADDDDHDAYDGLDGEELGDQMTDDDEESEEEDQWGRTVRPRIPESYRQEMLELEKQLNAGRIKNVGPAPGRISPDSEPEDSAPPTPNSRKRPIAAAPAKGALKSSKRRELADQGVRFAEAVDVSREPEIAKLDHDKLTSTPEAPNSATKRKSDPLSQVVVERGANEGVQGSSTNPTAPKKASRFLAARKSGQDTELNLPIRFHPATAGAAEKFAGTLLDASESRPAQRAETPGGPPGQTHSDVVEHQHTTVPTVPGTEGDDPVVQRRQIAADAYEKRNAVIQAQGGFRAPNPDAIPLDEEGNEVKKKVSRFKAARMGKDS